MQANNQSARELRRALIKREIELLLHSPLTEEEWEDLVGEHYIDEILDDEDSSLTSREVADKVRHRRAVYGKKKRKDKSSILSEPVTKEQKGRLQALALLVAQEAEKEEDVWAFRTEVLRGKLLPFEVVEDWIQEQAEADGRYTWWISQVPIPNETLNGFITVMMDRGMFETKGPALAFELECAPQKDELLFHFLKYSLAGTQEPKEMPTTAKGTLEHLRGLSEKLAEKYGWAEEQATLFVLTGHVPEITAVTASFQVREIPALTRLVLTVDTALSPLEVAEQYRHLRQQMMSGRYRSMSEKHTQLAAFAATQPEQKTWDEKMKEWNRTHPADWKYDEVANFAHDCLQAQRRLLRSEKE